MSALVARFAPVAAATEGNAAAHAALLQMQTDVEGRLTKSFLGKERFDRWGKHYVRAYLRAHHLGLQTNLMDEGLKSYGGALFQQVRDAGETIFKNMPPPQKPRPCCPVCGEAFGLDCTELEMQRHTESHFNGPLVPAAPVRRAQSSSRQVRAPAPAPAPNMSRYYAAEGGGCFARGSTAMVSRSGERGDAFVRMDVTAIQPGDLVRVAGGGAAAVACVARLAEPAGATLRELPSGLRITAKHPIRVDGRWQLPSEQPEAKTVPNSDGFVVNFVLRGDDGRTHGHGHVLLIDGIECASWGHGLEGDVIADSFWGSEKVVGALAEISSDKGQVDVRRCLRDEDGVIVGFV